MFEKKIILLAQLASQPAELFIYSVYKPSVCGSVCLSVRLSVTLNGVTNLNHWTQRPEILQTGTYWSPETKNWVTLTYFTGFSGHRRKCLCLSLQPTDLRSLNLHHGCTWQGRNSCLGFDLLLGVKGVTVDKKILGQPGWHKS